ncbi:MAG: SDR family NAD(P)-dependent oxidoreductase [Pseudomonadota bacterium]
MAAPSEVIWITGASSGIGRALALRMARDGHRIAASARNQKALERLAAEADGGLIRSFPLDVTDLASVKAAFSGIESALGPVDMAVLAAGNHHPVVATDFRSADMARLVDINLIGVANTLEPLMAAMIGRGKGRIAIVSSVAGYRGLPTSAYYGATKAALINLAESLKFDLDRHSVTMQLIDPGFVKTPLTDRNTFKMPFLISAEEAADAMVRGLRGRGFEITFPKRFTTIMKLLRCLPYRLYFPLVTRITGT